MQPELSIIIPAYREEKNIANTIQTLQKYFSKWIYKTEIIVIVDGCEATWNIAKNLADQNTKIFYYNQNQGKGFALKYGVQLVTGKYTIFYDAGMDFPIDNILLVFYTLKVTDTPIVIGSKRHPSSVLEYPWHRRILSFQGQILTKILFNLNVSDTQVGIKGFKSIVIQEIMQRTLVKRFAFDIEILVVGKIYGHRITEVPVRLVFNSVSSSIAFKAVRRVLIDVMAIFYRAKILRFYEKDLTPESIQQNNDAKSLPSYIATNKGVTVRK
jgi:glycosyltransferase involved in cell wall biosynthesis